MKKFSAVIICKNEEAMIEIMLKSIQWVDEIIICDTGSTDNTIEIARKYTDKVYSFPWIDDFWAARNYAKSFATNNWIISCDCDEEIEMWWIEKIKDIISKVDNSIDWIYVNMWNWASGYCEAVRVFRKELDWKWKIHECISTTNTISSWVNIRYGRSPTHDQDPLLDFRIMKKVYEEEPNNTRNLFYLAREYYYLKEYDKSEEIYKKYISIWTYFNEVTDAYYMLWKIYWENGKWQWELSREMLMKVIMRNCNFKSAYTFMAQQMIDEKKRTTWLKFADIADNSNCLFIH